MHTQTVSLSLYISLFLYVYAEVRNEMQFGHNERHACNITIFYYISIYWMRTNMIVEQHCKRAGCSIATHTLNSSSSAVARDFCKVFCFNFVFISATLPDAHCLYLYCLAQHRVAAAPHIRHTKNLLCIMRTRLRPSVWALSRSLECVETHQPQSTCTFIYICHLRRSAAALCGRPERRSRAINT